MDTLYYILRWIGGFCDIIDGVCVVLTLGFYNPNLGFKRVIYDSKRMVEKKMIKRGDKSANKNNGAT